MRRSILLAGLSAFMASAGALHAQRSVDVPPRLVEDVKYLSADELGGRMTGNS